ncbi:SDR family oxidoreductase [Paeniglutamicibacter cryotolerans]|uniref:Uncharacterized protein YbjT (DUF2867 family) n=1 Tax=Paeniglutamicibacter cryotolerans TaxID=670079 RepID=A0A839QGM3_9MICC|nr:SDR family oxidoreductase [Paeniglutamicibacter cryotolerans]MBB2994763.1 uncharacterized protein YbjT (DUF2867 family) [Paeniglutamicibacter cryotolerans]
MKITIIGGHGKVALILSRLLSERGDSVTSIIRNPDQAPAVAATGAHPLVLDIEGADTPELAEAFSGSDALIWSAGAGGGDPDRTYAVDRDAAIRSINAAEEAGVDRYVMVSFLTADESFLVPLDDPFYPYMAAKITADAHLRSSALKWTILAPGRLTDAEGSGLITPDPDPTADTATSRRNVALAAMACLVDPSSIGTTLGFSDGSIPLSRWIGGLHD